LFGDAADEADQVYRVSSLPFGEDVVSTGLLTVSASNDAVIPLNESHPGCPSDPNGLCSFDNVVSVLQKRSAEIDFGYDCFANYTAKAGMDYNGRAPRS
jgi:Ni,Fe-hydrogenase III small subunit